MRWRKTQSSPIVSASKASQHSSSTGGPSAGRSRSACSFESSKRSCGSPRSWSPKARRQAGVYQALLEKSDVDLQSAAEVFRRGIEQNAIEHVGLGRTRQSSRWRRAPRNHRRVLGLRLRLLQAHAPTPGGVEQSLRRRSTSRFSSLSPRHADETCRRGRGRGGRSREVLGIHRSPLCRGRPTRLAQRPARSR